MRKYFFIIFFLHFINSNDAYSQLIHQHADGTHLKYAITSFNVRDNEDLPGLGTLNFATIYFVEKEGKLNLIIDTPDKGVLIEGEMNIKNAGILASYGNKDSTNQDTSFTISKIKFKKTPWEKLNLKNGFFHFVTFTHVQPFQFLSYLCLNIEDPKIIRIAGYLIDDQKK